MALTGPRTTIARDDDLYPRPLLDLPDPPHELRILGNPDVLASPMLAVVGSRKCTPYGAHVAALIAEAAAGAHIPVVTGGAVGTPAHAIRSALEYETHNIVVLCIKPPGHCIQSCRAVRSLIPCCVGIAAPPRLLRNLRLSNYTAAGPPASQAMRRDSGRMPAAAWQKVNQV